MAAGRSSRELSTRAAQNARERVVAVVPVVVESYPVPPPRSDCVCVCVCVPILPDPEGRKRRRRRMYSLKRGDEELQETKTGKRMKVVV